MSSTIMNASLAMSLLLKCSCKALFQLKEDSDRRLRDHPRCHQILKSSKKGMMHIFLQLNYLLMEVTVVTLILLLVSTQFPMILKSLKS